MLSQVPQEADLASIVRLSSPEVCVSEVDQAEASRQGWERNHLPHLDDLTDTIDALLIVLAGAVVLAAIGLVVLLARALS